MTVLASPPRSVRRSGLLHRTCSSSVEPVSVLGVDGYPYGFNITIEGGKPLVLFAYATPVQTETRLFLPISIRRKLLH
jgi:hypothetical protein